MEKEVKEFKERKLTFREETARMLWVSSTKVSSPAEAFAKTDEFIKEMKEQRKQRKALRK